MYNKVLGGPWRVLAGTGCSLGKVCSDEYSHRLAVGANGGGRIGEKRGVVGKSYGVVGPAVKRGATLIRQNREELIHWGY